MCKSKAILFLFGILVIMGWVVLSAMQAGAETRNYKYYVVPLTTTRAQIGDADDHSMGYTTYALTYVFEDGEIASATCVMTFDRTKNISVANLYITMSFADGSSVIVKGQITAEIGVKYVAKNEFIKGTGRFEGIKGTTTGKAKYLPIQKGQFEAGSYGEGTWTYTLPSK